MDEGTEVRRRPGRPRKPVATTDSTFYDVFTAMPVYEQEIALRICTELHRQARRYTTETAVAIVQEALNVPRE